MTKEERELLLTVARIFRARLKEEPNDPSGNNDADYYDVVAALRPFDAQNAAPINQAEG